MTEEEEEGRKDEIVEEGIKEAHEKERREAIGEHPCLHVRRRDEKACDNFIGKEIY